MLFEQTNLILCVGKVNDHISKKEKSNIKLNGLQFVSNVIDGFQNIKSKIINNDTELINTMISKAQKK